MLNKNCWIARFQSLLVVTSLLLGASMGRADDKPSWFDQDTKTRDGWTFYCRADAANEKDALAQASAECSRKMCMLFGVEVEYKQTSKENLKDASTESLIIEKCPDVRIVGRVDKKKSIECEDKTCTAFLSQYYPMANYLEEKKRLNNPVISPTLEKEIIVREGNDTFKDPKACRSDLGNFRTESGTGEKNRLARVESLKSALKSCDGLDYRNVDLQNELQGDLFANFSSRGSMYATIVTPLIAQKSKLVEKIAHILQIESVNQSASTKKIQKLVGDSYDRLYFRSDHGSGYLEELKSCATSGKIIRQWPKNYFDQVSVCVANDVTHEKDCQDASFLMMRATYAGCVCNLGAPHQSGRCVEVLLQHFNEACPTEMTEECFRSMSKVVAEKMNFKMDVLKEK